MEFTMFTNMRSLCALALLSFITLGYAVPGPEALTGNTTLHDATMCKDESGKYFVFCMPIDDSSMQ
jgi:arabinan endo-1,5-alpha-L-arabinosidase